jgi:hypothetical protein
MLASIRNLWQGHHRYMSGFDSAWRKWHRAGVHGEALKAHFRGSTKPLVNPSVESKFDPRSMCIVLRISEIGPLPVEWSLLLGDAISNYRAALDHLAWAVVQRGTRAGTLSAKEERLVYYPIASTAEVFEQQIKTRVPGATPEDLAILRRYQPEIAGKTHCLKTLVYCSNLDKHRALQSMPLFVAQSQLTVKHLVDCELTKTGIFTISTKPRRPGAEIGRLPVRATGPHPRAFMSGRFHLDVSIEGKVFVRKWLNEMGRFAGAVLAEFADPPNGVLYVSPVERAAIKGIGDEAPET